VTYTVDLQPGYQHHLVVPTGLYAVPVSATPGATSTLVLPGPIKTWDDPRILKCPNRLRLLAAINQLFPQGVQRKNPLPDDPDDPFEATPGTAPYSKRSYRRMKAWSPSVPEGPARKARKGTPGTSCTGVAPEIVGAASGERSSAGWGDFDKPDRWIVYGQDPFLHLPSVGDAYVLFTDKKGKDTPGLRHIGFVLHVGEPGEAWITADGGQGDSQSGIQKAHLVRRKVEYSVPPVQEKYWRDVVFGEAWYAAPPFVHTAESDAILRELGGGTAGIEKIMELLKGGAITEFKECPYLGGPTEGGRLIGWIDMDAVPFKPIPLVPESTMSHYRKLGEWIEEARKATS
jgi:hypothetical protein